MKKTTKKSPIFCEHANESPAVCPCGAECYCKDQSCKQPKMKKRPKEPKLKPCPFCGSISNCYYFSAMKCCVCCNNCEANGPYGEGEKGAAACWNKFGGH